MKIRSILAAILFTLMSTYVHAWGYYGPAYFDASLQLGFALRSLRDPWVVNFYNNFTNRIFNIYPRMTTSDAIGLLSSPLPTVARSDLCRQLPFLC